MRVSRRDFILNPARSWNRQDPPEGGESAISASDSIGPGWPPGWLARLWARQAVDRAALLRFVERARGSFETLDASSRVGTTVSRSVAALDSARRALPRPTLTSAVSPAIRRVLLPPVSRPKATQVLLFAVVLTLLVTVAAVASVYSYLTRDLPPADQVLTTGMFQTAMIYDRRGRLLYEMVDPNGGRRSVVPLSDIPPDLIAATVMTEDANFYSNPGIDPLSILRALVQDVRYHHIMSGASTITQQLVRNVVMTPRERESQTIQRKIGEAILAYRLTGQYSKNEILQRYLNEIYYGNLAYGVEAASETYFDKPVQQLDLAQAALIAGLPQAPAFYDPYQHPDAAKQRQREVLDLMVKHGAITREQADLAVDEPLVYHRLPTDIQAPHFATYVRELIQARYDRDQIFQGGLHVYTSLDLDLQHQVEAIVKQRMPALASNDATNAAVVVIDPRTGEILALVGSADFWNDAIQGQVDMATAERPPASTIKPFTYLLAFDRHLAMPATVLQDSPVQYPMGAGQPPYQPRDADGAFRGPVTARRALANSLNVPVVELLDKVGADTLLTALHRFGITSLPRSAGYYGLSLTLGAEPVQLLDLTYAYATIANGGVQVGDPVTDAPPDQRQLAPVAVLKVTDAKGNVLDAYAPPSGARLASPEAAWLVSDVLSDDAARAETLGSHSSLQLPDRPAAVKTGTSENLRDAWAIGYTPGIVVGVWVGNTDNRPMKATFGAGGPALIWHDVMEAALKEQPAEPFARPSDLIQATVDSTTGLLPVPGRPTVTDWFVPGTVPTAYAPTPMPPPSPTTVPRAAPPEKPGHRGHGKR